MTMSTAALALWRLVLLAGLGGTTEARTLATATAEPMYRRPCPHNN